MIYSKSCKKLKDAGIEVDYFPPHLREEIMKDNINFIEQYSANPELRGKVSFDYTNNNGLYKIGHNELLFETKWSPSGNGNIYTYKCSETIETIAIAEYNNEISEVKDADIYNKTSDRRILSTGNILVLKNKNGYFAAIKILEVHYKRDDKGRNELKFEFKILPDKSSNFSKVIVDDQPLSDPLGYFIHVGTTSSRIFEVINKQTMNMIAVTSYNICDPKDAGYLKGIISHIKEKLLPNMKGNLSQLFIKVFADCNFEEFFKDKEPSIQKDFIRLV